MDISKIQALIAQGKILDITQVDPNDVYLQVGVYQYPNSRRASGDFNTYAPFVVSLSELGGAGGCCISAVTASAPLYSSGGPTPNITIPQAGPGVDGYISGAKWTDFNNKQDALGYVPEDQANKSNNTSLGTSSVLYPTQNAVKTYVDGSVTGLLDDRGNWDASTNLWPTTGGSGPGGTILKGDIWYVSVPGTLGGTPVVVGNSFRALVDNPVLNTDWAILSVGLGYVPANETTQILTTSPLGGGGDLSTDRTLTIQDAAADGTTKGAATFDANDFLDDGAGRISIDYTNGQLASGAVNGFLSSGDWLNFSLKPAQDTFIVQFRQAGINPADNTNYYFNQSVTTGNILPTKYLYRFPFNCRLVAVSLTAFNNVVTPTASAQLSSFYLRVNNVLEQLLLSNVSFAGAQPMANTYVATGLNFPVNSNDTACIRWLTPAWTTNPQSASVVVDLYFERL